jgi:hypothetical protein
LTNIGLRSIFHFMIPEIGPNPAFAEAERAYLKAKAEYEARILTILGDPETTVKDLPMLIAGHEIDEIKRTYLGLHELSPRSLPELEEVLARETESVNFLHTPQSGGGFLMPPSHIGYYDGVLAGINDAVNVVRTNTDPLPGLIRFLTWAQAAELRINALPDEELAGRSRFFEPGRRNAMLFALGRIDQSELGDKGLMKLVERR